MKDHIFSFISLMNINHFNESVNSFINPLLSDVWILSDTLV